MEIAIQRKLSLDLGYRYFGTAKGTFDKDFNRNVDLKFESHNATLGVRVKF
jgi:opacity protein-like surface antigen